ncbi:M56 family metallopeptidase [Cupriavidus basilensis]|uniref:Serine hydrolase n=1 Tax=Cupriavidus basilensis TaxID=68895 RepID=A0A643FWH5_9BURK|nr:serine hydrolase [Cupriavidus basilensis]
MSADLVILVQALGWALLHFLWKGALVGLATACLLRLLRDGKPQSRYAILCGALSLCLAIPVLDTYRYFTAAAAVLGDVDASSVLPALARRSAAPALMQQVMPWVVALWLSGVLAMATRLAAGLVWIRRISRAGGSWADARWQACVSQLAARCGVRRKIALRVAPQLPGPMTAGWWRPVVLVPAALLTQMPPALIEALLAHEVAHIRRMDFLVNLLQGVVEALLFFHPIVWWLSRGIRTEREEIADDIAAALIGEPRRVAIALEQLSQIQVAEARLDPMAQWAKSGSLSNRIRRLVRPNHRPLGWKILLLAGALSVAATGWLVSAQQSAPMLADGRLQGAVAAAARLFSRTAAHDALKAFVDAVEPDNVLVLDDNSGEVLLQKNEGNVVPIASLTKLMTAMVVLDAKPDMDRIISISHADADALKSIRSGLPVGTSLPLRQVMQLALMSSDNRAAYALARSYPGGLPAFEVALRAKISALGLAHTTLKEPTGLSAHNTSTAADVAIMASAASRYPEITHDTTNASDVIKINGKPVEYRNTNPLVGLAGWDIQLSKTGFTNEAGRCLIMRIKSAGKNITMVLLSARRTATWDQDLMKLRDLLRSGAVAGEQRSVMTRPY